MLTMVKLHSVTNKKAKNSIQSPPIKDNLFSIEIDRIIYVHNKLQLRGENHEDPIDHI